MAGAQYGAISQWMMKPVPQQPAAHPGRAFIEEREERRRGLATQRLGELEVAPGRGVEAHVFAAALGADRRDMSERLALGFRGVIEQRAAGADGERQIFAAVTRERGGAELF